MKYIVLILLCVVTANCQCITTEIDKQVFDYTNSLTQYKNWFEIVAQKKNSLERVLLAKQILLNKALEMKHALLAKKETLSVLSSNETTLLDSIEINIKELTEELKQHSLALCDVTKELDLLKQNAPGQFTYYNTAEHIKLPSISNTQTTPILNTELIEVPLELKNGI